MCYGKGDIQNTFYRNTLVFFIEKNVISVLILKPQTEKHYYSIWQEKE